MRHGGAAGRILVFAAGAAALLACLFAFRGAPPETVIRINPSALPKVEPPAGGEVFGSLASAGAQYRQRAEYARQLGEFLNGAKLRPGDLDALNSKFLVVGIRATEDGRAEVIPKDEWEDLIIASLAPPEKRPGLHGRLVRERLERARRLSSAAILASSSAIEEEEEEEEYYPPGALRVPSAAGRPSPREMRIRERERMIRNYLHEVFRIAADMPGHSGERDSIVNDYVDDTMSEYGRPSKPKN